MPLQHYLHASGKRLAGEFVLFRACSHIPYPMARLLFGVKRALLVWKECGRYFHYFAPWVLSLLFIMISRVILQTQLESLLTPDY